MKCLQAINLTKNFTQHSLPTTVLNTVNVDIRQGKSYAIMGISGSGKTTLLHLLAGLDTPSKGAVLLDGVDIACLSTTQSELYRNKTIGLLFQRPYMIKELSVLENVMLPGLIGNETYKQCAPKALSLLHEVGLESKANHKISALSGGEQQRVALARALFNEPAFLCADEPTGNLDDLTGKKIIDLLLTLSSRWNMGLIIATHDMRVAERLDVHYQLQGGQLVESASTFIASDSHTEKIL